METVGTRSKTLQIVGGVALAVLGVFLYAGGAGILVPTLAIGLGLVLVLLAFARG